MSDYWKVPGYPSPKFSANPRIKSNTKLWCQCFHISICCSNAGILQWLGHHIACWMSCRNLKWATNKKNMWLSFNFNYKVRYIIVIIQVRCFFRLLGSLELPPPKKKSDSSVLSNITDLITTSAEMVSCWHCNCTLASCWDILPISMAWIWWFDDRH